MHRIHGMGVITLFLSLPHYSSLHSVYSVHSVVKNTREFEVCISV